MDNLPENFLAYHYSTAVPDFIKTRPKHIGSVIEMFNVPTLLKNLFVPYKRIVAKEKTSLADRISFNLISAGIGAAVRLSLIAAGSVTTIFFIFFDVFAIFFYFLIPLFSLPKYLSLKNNYIFKNDLANSQKFLKKLEKTKIFGALTLFFDQNFVDLFSNLPQPESLGITQDLSPSEMIIKIHSNWPPQKEYLAQRNIKDSDFELLVNYLASYLENPPKAKPAPLGQMLSFGYTNTLDRFGTELTAKSLHQNLLKKEILTKIEKVLTRPENNNVLLVGEPGVGRHSTLEALAAAISKIQLLTLKDKRLIDLDIVALLGASKNMAEIKSNFESLLEEAKRAGNIILAIDQIDRISTSQEGRMDLSEVLTSLLTDNSLPIIGITTIDNFANYVRPNTNLLSLFEKIDVEEPEKEETETILFGKAIKFYSEEKISTSLAAIVELVDKSTRLIPDRKQPEKSIILLGDAIAEAKRKKISQVDISLVDEILASTTKTPVGKIKEAEAEKLTDLEAILHKRIVGQNEAILQISKAMRRARAEIESTKRPMGSFLFLGPTGVGKTETAKALAEAYFGADDKMVRLDMTEFQGDDALNRLIGNLETKTQGQLANLIREHPFGILLLDEFEKAAKLVQNLFLQILDEGNLTDAFGKKVSFTNIIIIATSNAAAEYIREQVAAKTANLDKKLVDFVLSQGFFNPELLNRFDAVVVYHPLTQEEVQKVSKLMLEQLAQKLKEGKNITLAVTDNLAKAVAEKSYDAQFGARPIRRFIADKIEDEIAKMIIANEVTNGSTIPVATLLKFLG